MGRIKSVYKAINNLKMAEGHIPYADNFEEIGKNSKDDWDKMWDSFRFGYLQGMKAAKAERRRAV